MYFFSQSLQNRCNLPIKGRSVHNKKNYKTYVKTFIVAIKNLKTVNIISLKKNFFVGNIHKLFCIFRGGLPAVKCGRKSDYGGSSVQARNRECDGAFLAH